MAKKAINGFLDRLRAGGRSKARINKIRRTLDRIGAWVDWNFSLDNLTDYLNDRRQNVAPKTLSSDVQILKQFLKDCGAYWIDRIPAPKVPRKKAPIVRRDDILDYLDVLETAEVSAEKYYDRAKAAVVLSSVSGMRPYEVYRLDWSDIDLEARHIELEAEKTKTKEARDVIFNSEARGLLEGLKPKFPAEPFNHKTIYLLTRGLDPKPDFKFKNCRKYFSQVWDRADKPTSVKEILLGHFGSIDRRHYSSHGVSDLRGIYDGAGIQVLS